MDFLKKLTSEDEVIGYTDIIEVLQQVGIEKNDNLIVHVSMKSLGYVVGGVESIYRSFIDIVSEDGTIIVPAQSIELSHPGSWQNPPIKREWVPKVAELILPFNKRRTPVSPELGIFCNYFSSQEETIRTNHPLYSFSIYGKLGKNDMMVNNKNLDFPFDMNSPLGWLYKNKGKIVMLGTDFETNTAIHLSETIVYSDIIEEKAKVLYKLGSRWVRIKNIELEKYDDFKELEKKYCQENQEAFLSCKLGNGLVRVFDFKNLVDYSARYYNEKEKQYKYEESLIIKE